MKAVDGLSSVVSIQLYKAATLPAFPRFFRVSGLSVGKRHNLPGCLLEQAGITCKIFFYSSPMLFARKEKLFLSDGYQCDLVLPKVQSLYCTSMYIYVHLCVYSVPLQLKTLKSKSQTLGTMISEQSDT